MNEKFNEISELTKYDSFRHVLAEIVYQDFCGTIKELKTDNVYDKTDYNELLLLMGLWVKNVDSNKNISKEDTGRMVSQTLNLLKELHYSFITPLIPNTPHWLPNFKEMFFYAPTHAYDLQYANLVYLKYRNDINWIKKNTGQIIENFKLYFFEIKYLIIKRLNDEKLIKRLKIKNKIINLFIINKTKEKRLFDIKGFNQFLEYFSVSLHGINQDELNDIGDFNPCKEKPIIKLDEHRYFIPSTFHLAESMWESFFYKMVKSEYESEASKHRGEFAEQTVYCYLKNVFSKVYKNIHLLRNKKEELTDIDVCIIEDKTMIIFMVKSKKLTLLSRKGDVLNVQKDYQYAITESFEQGLLAKKCILNGNFEIVGDNNMKNELKNVNEIYLYTVILDDYPFLSFQNLLFAKEYSDMPISISIFDLEIILNYICDAKEFIRYTKLRHFFLKKMNMNSEMSFLEFFRTNNKLTFEEYDRVLLENDWSQAIDSDFYDKLLKGENRKLINIT
jgi:hypothetical protein